MKIINSFYISFTLTILMLFVSCVRKDTTDDNLYGLFVSDIEPNDTFTEAIEVPTQRMIAGFMNDKGNVGDRDYYKVTFAQHGVSYKVMLTGVPGVDSTVQFFGANGRQLFITDEGGIGESEKVWDYYPTDGSVYVCIRAKTSFNEKIPYYLTFTPKGDNSIEEIEPNNTEETALSLSENDKKKGLIFPKNDVDYYRLNFTSTHSLVFSVKVEPLSNIDVFFTLYDKTNNIIKLINNNTAGITEQIKYLDSGKGSYYIRIGGNTDRTDKRDPAYSVIVTVHPDTDLNGSSLCYEQEFNDEPELATDIWERSNIVGMLFPDNDEDWYRFDVLNETNTVNISLSEIRGLDTVIEIYDNRKTLMHTIDSSGADGHENISLSNMPLGRYFMRLSAKKGSSMINYSLFCNIN